MRRIIAVLLENEAGALSRVVGLFAQRNYNIDSLTVAPTEDPSLSRLTLTTVGDDRKIEQIIKHLYKVIEVITDELLREWIGRWWADVRRLVHLAAREGPAGMRLRSSLVDGVVGP